MTELSSAAQSGASEPANTGSPGKIPHIYLWGIGIFANILIWGLAIAYLKFTPKIYQSEWGINVLGSARGVDVSLPDGLRTSSSSASSQKLTSEDPRSDYVYLLKSPDLVKAAAEEVNLSVEAFGAPEITTNSQSSIIGFVVEGGTPQLARDKSMALYNVLDQRLDSLRKAELSRREKENLDAIDKFRKQVDEAQADLTRYQTVSGLSSEAQIDDLAVGLEQLRRDYAQSIAQSQGLSSRVQQLEQDITDTSEGATDIYRLQGDAVYNNQFEEYGTVAAEYADLSSQLGTEHPRVAAKRAELNGLLNALETRAAFLLGRRVDQSELTQLAAMGQDPRIQVSHGELFREVVIDRASQVELKAGLQELSGQIEGLEGRLQRLSQDKVVVDRLKRNLQASEALLASAIATLNVNEDDIYTIYPPIQLAAEPTLPDEDKFISPTPSLAIVGALAGSFVTITGLMLLANSNFYLFLFGNKSALNFPFKP